ncbi:MAG TPA: GTPase ObgE, partial [Pyrinomonadaceae bacterium]|nr:GTPase ObgE [Pyrinomonadaceae bacterium]
MFIDRTKIRVQGGHGGNGVTAFRREKFVPRGGPSGGDGGRGGDVWMEADESLNTLLHLRYNPEHIAERGRHGEGSNRSGREGLDTTVRVPVGTQVFDAATSELLKDFTEHGERWLAAKGGRGGFGNSHF